MLKFPDMNELDDAACKLSGALAAVEDVYMEVGMRAGARMLYSLLQNREGTPL